MSELLVVIPARGGSKGIPRKNLRQLSGVPLIAYSIQVAQKSKFKPHVLVTSEDREILTVARLLGADIHERDPILSDANVTLDPVIHDAVGFAEEQAGKSFDAVITFQPTSPLLKTSTFDEALSYFLKNEHIDTLISAQADTHLSWTISSNGIPQPAYTERLNRQQLKPSYREVGALVISRRHVVKRSSRIGDGVDLFPLEPPESIDIDTFDDFALCQYYLNRRHIVFSVTGHRVVGLGHIHRCLTLASHLVDHELTFFVDADSDLGAQKIEHSNYIVRRPRTDDWVEDVIALRPDLVINDRLDTDAHDIQRLKASGAAVINFEDLGSGTLYADRVINAMYPPVEHATGFAIEERMVYGPAFFCARDEFRLIQPKEKPDTIKKILITFGGTDPSRLTEKVLTAIAPICMQHDIRLTVVLGIGVDDEEAYNSWNEHAEIYCDVRNMAELMHEADLVFTSAGRTLFEIAAVGVPGIVLAQNSRELTHSITENGHGLINLGLGKNVGIDVIRQVLKQLLERPSLYYRLYEGLRPQYFRAGIDRVTAIIRDTLARHELNEQMRQAETHTPHLPEVRTRPPENEPT